MDIKDQFENNKGRNLSENQGGRKWGFILFVALLSALGAFAILFFDIEMQRWFRAILAFSGLFGLIWLILYIIGFAKFGEEEESPLEFSNIADGIKDAVIVTQNDGTIVYSNQSYLKLLQKIGSKAQNDQMKPELALAGNPEINAELYNLSNAAKTGQDYYVEMRLKRAENSTIEKSLWVSVQITKLTKGEFEGGALWQIQNITNRSERQEQMINKLKQTIDYLEDAPIGFFSSDKKGDISFMNATLARWLGGKSGTDFEKKNLKQVVGKNAALMLDFDDMHIDIQDHVNVDQTSTLDLIKPSGDPMPSKIIHRMNINHGEVKKVNSFVMPEQNLDGKFNDISADILFSRFFNLAPIGMAALNKAGQVLSCNPTFKNMFYDKKVMDNLLGELVSPSSKESIERAIEQASIGNIEAVPIDFSSGKDQKNNGQIYFNRVRVELDEQDEDYENIQLIAYLFDTTQQRSLEEQFSQGQKMQAVGLLAGGVAHDFNNVLSAILGTTELLLSEMSQTDPSHSDLMSIKNNSNRAAGLVRGLLAFSRKQTLRPQTILLSDMISELSVLFDQLKAKGVNIHYHHSRDLGLIKADENKLENIFVNMIINAGHAMPKGGNIYIKTRNVVANEVRNLDKKEMTVQDYVLISIEDTGTGMSEEVQKKIFLPFFTTKAIGKGTGLGLSTAYGFVKQTGGFIYVDSHEGVGTRFDIYLPRQYPTEEEMRELANNREKKKDKPKDLSGKGTILLVDDEAGVRTVAVRALQARGYTLIEAETGAEALEVLEEFEGELDLIISDVMMPEMDGPTMYNNLPEKYKKVPTVFMSGYAQDEYRDQIAADANIGFLAKPVGIKTLAETAKIYIQKADAEQN